MTSQNDFFKTPAEIFKDFQEHAELQDYANKQYEFIMQLQQENDKLKQENAHLKQVLNNGMPSVFPKISDEEIVCLKQIALLKAQSEKRELTLDEVKKLDLLHKNLKMIREHQVIDVKPSKQKTLSNEKLLAIVTKKSEELNDE